MSLDIAEGFLGNAINRLGALIADIRGGRSGAKFAADAGVIEKPGEQALERGAERRIADRIDAHLRDRGARRVEALLGHLFSARKLI